MKLTRNGGQLVQLATPFTFGCGNTVVPSELRSRVIGFPKLLKWCVALERNLERGVCYLPDRDTVPRFLKDCFPSDETGVMLKGDLMKRQKLLESTKQ